MVPPPDNTGDVFPDFDNMSVEEQMAWLESLAKRQGAGEDELTTSADVDIPTPENAVVDEPGYVPFEGSRSARELQEAALVDASIESPEPAAAMPDDQPDEAAPVEEETEPVQAFAEESDVSDEDDPMHWLDSLTAQPEADVPVLDQEFDAIDADMADEFAAVDAPVGDESVEDAVPDAQMDAAAVASDADEDDPLGGIDPMLWLESLAARQGADTSGFTTNADMEIDESPEDTVVDEPGYVPFEGSRSAREWQQQQQPVANVADADDIEDVAAAESAEAESVSEVVEPSEMVAAEQLEPVDELDTVGEGDESMEWLESLAKRQGASEEELLTSADVDVPELPDDTVVDEPGYVAYDPLSIRPGAGESARKADVDDEADELAEMLDFAGEEADEGLSWLEDLAAVPDDDVDFLSFDEDVQASTDQQAVAAEPEAAEPPAASESDADVEVAESIEPADDDTLLAGMTDDEIAQLQAEGTLTPQQELAWLKRQARTLVETREAEAGATEGEELEPAERGQLPSWLEELRQEGEEETAAVAETILGEDDLESQSLPDWLQEPEETPVAAVEDDMVDLDGLMEDVTLDEDVDSLWAESVEPDQSAVDLDESMPDSELAAFISGDFVPDEVDPLAEALDEEFDRRTDGDEEEPDWYTAAVAKVASDAPPLAETESSDEADTESVDEAALAAAEPADVPGWLADETPDEPEVATPETVAASDDMDSDMPDWLREVDEDTETAAIQNEALPNWLVGEGEEAPPDLDDLPDWLVEEDQVSAAAEPDETSEETVESIEAPEQETTALVPEPEPEPPMPVSDVEPEVAVQVADAALPDGELFEQYRERLETNANDHPSRLALARALRSNEQADLSLDHYEVLIEAGQLLDDVVADLNDMAKAYADQPRMRRVLGDAYMRQGKLSAALDAYRAALHQL